jgi:hypothetical protein
LILGAYIFSKNELAGCFTVDSTSKLWVRSSSAGMRSGGLPPVFPFSLANQKSLAEDDPSTVDFSLDVSGVRLVIAVSSGHTPIALSE